MDFGIEFGIGIKKYFSNIFCLNIFYLISNSSCSSILQSYLLLYYNHKISGQIVHPTNKHSKPGTYLLYLTHNFL